MQCGIATALHDHVVPADGRAQAHTPLTVSHAQAPTNALHCACVMALCEFDSSTRTGTAGIGVVPLIVTVFRLLSAGPSGSSNTGPVGAVEPITIVVGSSSSMPSPVETTTTGALLALRGDSGEK